MTARRSVISGVLAAAVTVPLIFCLAPALFRQEAPSFRDQADFFYPTKLYTVDRLRRGDIPLWNPLSAAGEPWLANGQSGVFYPPTLFFLLPSPGLAAALFLLFHLSIAAWGFRRFVKDEGVSEAAALFGGAVFCAGGFALSLASYWNHFGAWAYFPGVCALARTGLETRRRRLALALLIGLSSMAGSPELTLATLAAAVPFALIARPVAPEGWEAPHPRRGIQRLGISTLLGLVLAGWVLVPMAELAVRSDRRGPLPVAERDAGAAELSIFSSALGIGEHVSATSYFASLYVGPVVILAAVAAVGEPGRRTLVVLLIGLACLGALVSMKGWPGPWIRAIPPLDRLRYPAKALLFPHFALAVLASLGLDRQAFAPGGRMRRIAFSTAAVAALAIVGLCERGEWIRWSCGAAGIGFLLLSSGLARWPALARTLAIATAISLAVALALAGQLIFRFVPDGEIRREPESIASLSHVAGRIVTPPMGDLARRCLTLGPFDTRTIRCQRESLLGYTNLLFDVRTVRTASALPTLAAKRIEESMDLARDPVAAAGPVSARVLWTPFQPARLPSLKVGDFFRAPLAPYRPRLSFVHSYRVLGDATLAWNEVASGQSDLVREVFLDRAPETRFAGETAQTLLVARTSEDRAEKVAAEITSSTPGILVLTDLWYPGWTAQVDGKAAELRRADGFFRGVPLPPGNHRVVFRYKPLSVPIGAAVSGAGILTLLLAALARPPGRESLL